MQIFAQEEGYGDLLDTYESADAELRFLIKQMRDDRKTPNSPTFIPGQSRTG